MFFLESLLSDSRPSDSRLSDTRLSDTRLSNLRLSNARPVAADPGQHREDYSEQDCDEEPAGYHAVNSNFIDEMSLSTSMKVVVLFRRPICRTDRLIKPFIGQFTHMEVMIYLDKSPRSSPTFTAYMGEPFSSSIMAKTQYRRPTFEAYHLETNTFESERLLDYLIALTELRIPYNYEDLPLIPFKSLLLKTEMVEDVDDDHPREIKRLFCSQAFTVAFRKCLEFRHYGKLIAELKAQNSRLTTPCDFFHIVRPYCRQVDPEQLRWGEIKYI